MKSKVFGFLVAGFVFLAFAGAAQANDACYTWDCNPSTQTCQFDASCSTITSGRLWKYFWDFGDGTTALTGGPTYSHAFPYHDYPTVELTLVFFDVDSVSESCGIVVQNRVGPELPLSGTCD